MSEKPCSIVCIEDETEIREAIADMLQDEGYRVTQAANGREGLEAILRIKPNLIICDIYMPHMDGFTVCREFRARMTDDPHIPFLFLSALPQDAEKLKKQKVRIDGYLTKPIDFDLLLAQIRQLTESPDSPTPA
jgi:CheY-like chemotaxis protein